MKTLSLSEVARRLGIGYDLARKIAQVQFRDAAVRIGARTRYREDRITVFVEAGGYRPAPATEQLTNR